MKNNHLLLFIAFCVICNGLLFSCFDEISFKSSEDQFENLVIQGKLIKGNPSIVSVRINELSDFIGFETPVPVDVSSVSLLDENQNTVELALSEPGLFQLEIPEDPSGFVIQSGHAYQIQVVTATGEIYESALDPLLPVPQVSSMNVELIDREEINETGGIQVKSYLKFYINTPLAVASNPQNSFLKWEMEGCFRFIETLPLFPPTASAKTCYITEALNLDKINVFNGEASSLANLTEHPLIEIKVSHRFARGYYLTVHQQSLSEQAFEYWNKVSQIVERTGSIFEPAPGKIQGNISNPNNPEEEVFGYFYTSIQDTFYLFVPPEVANSPTPFCPGPDDGIPIPDECYSCLTWPNSTLDKPAYWED